MKTHYLGRLSIRLPETFKLKGSSFFTRQITLSSVDLDQQEGLKRTAEGYWADKLNSVRKRGTSRSSGDFEAIIDDEPLGPNVRAVYYRTDTDGGYGMQAALLEGRRGTLITSSWSEFYHDDAKDRALTASRRAIFAQVVAAHRFPPDGARGPIDPQAIYLPFGIVTLAPPTGEESDVDDSKEVTRVAFDDHQHNVSMFTLSATRPWEPSKDNEPGFLERISKTFIGFAFGISRVRGGKRVVAGLSGEELIFKARGDDDLSFSWVYEPPKGIDWHRYVPKIVVDLETITDDGEASFPKWNEILDSVQILPDQKGGGG